jgi:hypothetical protein
MKTEIKPLVDAIAIIGRITGTDLIGMKLAKKKLTLTGENGGRSMSVTIPHPAPESWECAVTKQSLDQTFKGRKELDIAMAANGHINFKASRFEASFATQPYTSGSEVQAESEVEITEAQQELITHGVSVAALTPIYEGDTIFCVESDKKHTYIACFDQLHFALVEAAGAPGNLTFAFPTKTFETLNAASGKGSFRMSTTSAAIVAWHDNWKLILPFIQNEVAQTISDVKGLADQFGSSQLRCSSEKLYKAIEAASSAIETGGSVKIQVKDDMIRVLGSSNIGTVSEKLECKRLTKTWKDVNIDPSVAMSLLALAPSEFIEFGVHQDRFFFIRAEDETSKITYGCILSEAAE